MEFEGHELLKIENNWVFDITTFIGYKVELENNIVSEYKKAFIAIRDKSTGNYSFDKIIDDIPLKILRKVVNIIQRYRREALLENANC